MSKEKKKANWIEPETTVENEVLPKYFKWVWTSRGVSLGINVILIMQLTYYCTDMLGMTPTLIGSLLLASKLFDGVTDLIVGFIIDKTNTRFGKARPYEVCIVLVWIFTILLFSTPNLSMAGKAVFIFIMYTLINSVCATFLNGTDAVYLARSVRSEKNRVSVMSFNGAILMTFSIVMGMVLPQLIAGIGTTKIGWTIIAAGMGIPLAIIGMLRFVFVKEVAVAPHNNRDKNENDSLPFKKGLKCVFSNKYIWILAMLVFIANLITNIGTAVQTYYFKYIIGNIGMATFIGMASFVTPIMLAVFPMLAKKFGTGKLIKMGAVLGIAGYGIRTIGGSNFITLMIGSVMGTIATLPITMMISIYLIDVMDYGEWKTGTRVEGMLGSVTAFMSKLGSGIASGLVGIIMGLAGYNGSLAVQSATANTAIIALFNIVPLILMVFMLIFGVMYNLEKRLPQIKSDLAERHCN